jgi:carbamoyl-phosphate synthase large subunit
MNTKIRVGITSFGSNTAIGVAKMLRSAHNNVEIVGIDSNSLDETSGYRYTDFFHQVPLALQSKEYINAINKIIVERNISILIPIHDVELIVLSRNLEKIHCKVAVNNMRIVELCGNKLKSNQYVSKFVNVPEFGIDEVLKKNKVIIKSIDGVGSKDVKVQNDCYRERVPKGFFWQEFISGTEYTVDCYRSYVGDDFFAYPRIRIDTKGGIATKTVGNKNPELMAICQNILEGLDYRGVANIQFIENNGEYFFIEINPRFAGSGILSYSHGLNAPSWTIQELLGYVVNFGRVKLEYNKKMVRYFNEVFHEIDS